MINNLIIISIKISNPMGTSNYFIIITMEYWQDNEIDKKKLARAVRVKSGTNNQLYNNGWLILREPYAHLVQKGIQKIPCDKLDAM